MVHVKCQKVFLAVYQISKAWLVNSLGYRKSLILYWMTLVDLAHHEIVRAKVGKGGIKYSKNGW